MRIERSLASSVPEYGSGISVDCERIQRSASTVCCHKPDRAVNAQQEGEHTPVDDARAALYLYHRHAKAWEHALKEHGSIKSLRPPAAPGSRREALKSLADLAAKDPMADL